MNTKRIPNDRQKYLITTELHMLEQKGQLVRGEDGVYLDGLTIDDVLGILTKALKQAKEPMEGGVSKSTLQSQVKAVTSMPLRTPRRLSALSLLQTEVAKLAQRVSEVEGRLDEAGL